MTVGQGGKQAQNPILFQKAHHIIVCLVVNFRYFFRGFDSSSCYQVSARSEHYYYVNENQNHQKVATDLPNTKFPKKKKIFFFFDTQMLNTML